MHKKPLLPLAAQKHFGHSCDSSGSRKGLVLKEAAAAAASFQPVSARVAECLVEHLGLNTQRCEHA